MGLRRVFSNFTKVQHQTTKLDKLNQTYKSNKKLFTVFPFCYANFGNFEVNHQLRSCKSDTGNANNKYWAIRCSHQPQLILWQVRRPVKSCQLCQRKIRLRTEVASGGTTRIGNNLIKRWGINRVFQGLAVHLRGIYQQQSPREILRSSFFSFWR